MSCSAARQAVAQAEAEGLELLRSSNNATGFVGVRNDKSGLSKPYQARMRRDGNDQQLGVFATAEEAALACARARAEVEGAVLNGTQTTLQLAVRAQSAIKTVFP